MAGSFFIEKGLCISMPEIPADELIWRFRDSDRTAHCDAAFSIPAFVWMTSLRIAIDLECKKHIPPVV
jgi:hypothetical protein